jgi:hypothetical protein
MSGNFRFLRDLRDLKITADYSSCDFSEIKEFLSSINPGFAAYTYPLVKNGVSKEVFEKCSSDDQLLEWGVIKRHDQAIIIHALRGNGNL